MDENRNETQPAGPLPGKAESVWYRTDIEGCITEVNAGWQKFAAQNHGEAVAGSLVLGTKVWVWITDESVRKLYELLF